MPHFWSWFRRTCGRSTFTGVDQTPPGWFFTVGAHRLLSESVLALGQKALLRNHIHFLDYRGYYGYAGLSS